MRTYSCRGHGKVLLSNKDQLKIKIWINWDFSDSWVISRISLLGLKWKGVQICKIGSGYRLLLLPCALYSLRSRKSWTSRQDNFSNCVFLVRSHCLHVAVLTVTQGLTVDPLRIGIWAVWCVCSPRVLAQYWAD